jgi:hypothetical protein
MSKSRRHGLFGRREEVNDNPQQDDRSDDWLEATSSDDEEALESLRHSDAVRPLNITPEAERFPPLAPRDEAEARPKPAPVKTAPKRVYEPIKWGTNLFTLLMLIATCALVGAIVTIWQNPYTPLNPLPPATPFIEITATPDGILPTAMPTIAAPATIEADTGDTSQGGAAFAGDVIYQSNANNQGCDWTSIAGTVQASDGNGLNGYRVVVDDGTQEQVVFTGSAEQFGPGGWELALGNTLISGQYSVQLANTIGEAVSDPLLIDLPGDCAANVAVINWQQDGAPAS